MKFKVTVVLEETDVSDNICTPEEFMKDIRTVVINELNGYGFVIVGDVTVERVDA